MIGHCAGKGEPILHHVEPVHVVFRATHPAPQSESTRGRDAALATIEKITVQRENHIGALDPRPEPHVGSESDFGRVVHRLTQKRLVDTPTEIRKNFLQLAA